jgi:hypothetical protein
MNVALRNVIYDFLENMAHEFPRLEWELDENDQIVIWEEEE